MPRAKPKYGAAPLAEWVEPASVDPMMLPELARLLGGHEVARFAEFVAIERAHLDIARRLPTHGDTRATLEDLAGHLEALAVRAAEAAPRADAHLFMALRAGFGEARQHPADFAKALLTTASKLRADASALPAQSRHAAHPGLVARIAAFLKPLQIEVDSPKGEEIVALAFRLIGLQDPKRSIAQYRAENARVQKHTP